mmetsp:Transcript_4296/g.5577  ORF Transcript_4296/g.5577 Transcript_4296/m.5577 type:complete len:638 (+) Transcript_4296:182-2095(+)
MQRRNKVDPSSRNEDEPISRGTNTSASVPNKRKIMNPHSHSLPMHRNKTSMKKKKFSLVQCMVISITILIIAISTVMLYIATSTPDSNLKSGGEGILNVSSSTTEFGKNQNQNSIINVGSDSHIHDHHVNTNMKDISEMDMGDQDAHAEQKPKRRRRTTEEANAYMAEQPSYSVDGEKALRKELIQLFDMQKKGQEQSSPIITRWIGGTKSNGEKLPYWLPKSKTSDEVLEAWQTEVEKLKDDMRHKDVELFPELHTEKEIMEMIQRDEEEKKRSSQMDFPLPSPKDSKVILQPTFGKHRSHVDAIFGLAEGYDLQIYLLFIESLKATGFNGDLVLSVSALGSLKPGVEDYLRSNHKDENEDGINVVVYTVTWTCYTGDGTVAEGANGGIRKCELVDMYGTDTDEKAIKDPREPRPVATARFELYWAWSQYYDDANWIMLIDTRDAHFQLNPFANLRRGDKEDMGLLYFFAENAEVSSIGQSKFNSGWLKEAYGKEIVKSYSKKPIICSGSTMGQKVAMEPYLRAMIAQFDKTKCKAKGCDQGFHNYLYYSGALSNVKGIKDVVEFEQGKGLINNLGVLRTKPLREWGLLNDENLVLNWDGSVSAVAHQFDRDDELNKHLKGIRRQYVQTYMRSKAK